MPPEPNPVNGSPSWLKSPRVDCHENRSGVGFRASYPLALPAALRSRYIALEQARIGDRFGEISIKPIPSEKRCH